MEGLMLHCGGEPATMSDLRAVPLPAKTETYSPVAHHQLIKKVIAITTDVLPVKLIAQGFGLAKDGQRLFAHLRFSNGIGSREMGLCLGIVNSYDKRLPVKIAAGANVFVCDNLALRGEITYMRKHTGDVWNIIEDAIRDHIGSSEDAFLQVLEDVKQMKRIKLTNDKAYQILGLLYGNRMLTNPMMTIARKEWDEPSHKAFEARTTWSLYNAITAALKLARPEVILERHRDLHEFLTGRNFKYVA